MVNLLNVLLSCCFDCHGDGYWTQMAKEREEKRQKKEERQTVVNIQLTRGSIEDLIVAATNYKNTEKLPRYSPKRIAAEASYSHNVDRLASEIEQQYKATPKTNG